MPLARVQSVFREHVPRIQTVMITVTGPIPHPARTKALTAQVVPMRCSGHPYECKLLT